MLKRVAIKELAPGMVINRITVQHGPVKIKKSGLVTSEDMINGLLEMGVSEVEIDPDQTVELETEETTTGATTQTQALLRGQYDRQGHFDNQLADQFNRNLFLPSVQGIPSVWQVYLRQLMIILVTVFAGAGLGFAAATHNLWFPSDKQTTVAMDAQVTHNTTEKAAVTPSASSVDQAKESVANSPVQQTLSAQSIQTPTEIEATGNTSFNGKAEQEAEQVAEQGVELDPNVTTSQSAVSPELLRKFNQAIEELDNEKASTPEPRAKEAEINIHNDIPRIDQLPVRVMTNLPTMTFSAHMYASRSQDRWVRVNGRRLGEGDVIADTVQIVSIEPQRIILTFRGEMFSMAALTDW